jgi:hypothetical protein
MEVDVGIEGVIEVLEAIEEPDVVFEPGAFLFREARQVFPEPDDLLLAFYTLLSIPGILVRVERGID